MKEDLFVGAKAAYIRRVILLVFLDYLSIWGAFFLGLWLRFDFRIEEILVGYLGGYLLFVLIWGMVCLAAFWLFGLYRSIWRFASEDELLRVVAAYGDLGLGLGVYLLILYLADWGRMP